MKNRINILVIVAVIVFTVGAKYIQPFESDLKSYGFLGMAFIILLLSCITIFIEYILHKIYLGITGKKSRGKD
ncbi:hypothetical protein ACU5B6_26995 [Moritella viscosa]|uniref:hypothetical protein n=1 Tax=Moritella viscosa TaxID=80854 RepID=UPI00094C0FDD|nr:hypothetical protein [Moritella viscosa]